MKNSISRFKHSMTLAQKNEPHKSWGKILIEKINRKIRVRYDLLLSAVLKDSTFREVEDLYMCSLFPINVIDKILQEFNPNSILDVGCGTGISLKYFLHKNIDAIGVENSMLAIKNSAVSHKIIRHNLKKQLFLNKKFDLVWSFEVIEHIHPDFEAIFLNTLVQHSDRVIISAALPGQGGHGHFNEQLPEYWVEKFSKLNFQLNVEMTECLRNINEKHANNLLVLEKRF